MESLPAEKLAGVKPCRGGKLAWEKSLPGEDLAGAEKLAVKELAGWKLSRPIRPEAEDGLK